MVGPRLFRRASNSSIEAQTLPHHSAIIFVLCCKEWRGWIDLR